MDCHVGLSWIATWFYKGDIGQLVLSFLEFCDDMSKLVPRVGSVSSLKGCKWTESNGCSLGSDFLSHSFDNFQKETSPILN